MSIKTGRLAGMLALIGAMLLAACGTNGGNSPQATETNSPVSSSLPTSTAVILPTAIPTSAATDSLPGTGETIPPATAVPATASAPSAAATPTVTSVTQFPSSDNAQWAPVASGLVKPTDLKDPSDGSGRLFILEQPGRIRVLQNGQLLETPFLDITRKVGSQGTEQGLLGLAFDPNYAQNGIFYTNYTDTQGNSVVAQWHVSSSDPNQADPQSEQILLTIDQPFQNHNGGGVQFGRDGYLYLSFGDGGSGGDPHGNGQNTNTLLATILRIQPNLQGGYSIPPSNPFANGQGGRAEIFVYGLRNPWRFSFDQATGDLYIADVGQNQWEEVDFLPAGSPGGENFGWNYYEGNHVYAGQPPQGMQFTFPVSEYSHAQGGCSVTGGMVYRGQALPAWQGVYLFGDYCSGLIWGLVRDGQGQWQTQQLFQTSYNPSAFGQDSSGEIYLLDHSRGQVLRLQPK